MAALGAGGALLAHGPLCSIARFPSRLCVVNNEGETVVVGVNRYGAGTPATADIDVFRIDPQMERLQCERVRAVRASRDDARWRDTLAAVEAAAQGSTNLVPPIIAAVEGSATLGEIAETLRRVFGEYRDVSPA